MGGLLRMCLEGKERIKDNCRLLAGRLTGGHILQEPKKPFGGLLFLFPYKGISHFVIYFLLNIPIFRSNVAAPYLLAITTNGTLLK